MTTKTPTSETAMVDPRLIDVAKDFNPRTSPADATEDKLLMQSVAAHGVKQSLLVTRGEKGRFTLVAGHRRLKAALAAKASTVPVVIDKPTEASATHALLENMARKDLNPLEEAAAIEEILATTKVPQKTLAQALGVSPSHISERRRLLVLPPNVQQAIINRELPAGIARYIEPIAKINQTIAAHIGHLFMTQIGQHWRTEPEYYASQIFHKLKHRVGQSVDDLPVIQAIAPLDFPLHPRNTTVAWTEEQQPLATAFEEYSSDAEWRYAIPGPDSDAMTSTSFIGLPAEEGTLYFTADHDLITTTIESAILDHEAEVVKREAEKAASKDNEASASDTSTKDAPEGPSDYEIREQARADAYHHNTAIGNLILKKTSTIKPTIANVRALALAYLLHNEDLAGAGLALVDERLQTVETITQKNGKIKTKVTYPSNHDAFITLEKRITAAKTIDEILGHILSAIAAAELVDPNATLSSDRRHWAGLFGSYSHPDSGKPIRAEIDKLKTKVTPPNKKKPASKPAPKTAANSS